MFIKLNQINIIFMYALPVAAFSLLISSALTNIFLLVSVLYALQHCIRNSNFQILFDKKFFKFIYLLFAFLLCSSLYSVAETADILSLLKKYVKLLYIPILYYLIKVQKNEKIIMEFFIYGCSIILFLSYVKYYNLFNFSYFYDFLKYINLANVQEKIIITRASIFQNYIIQGTILSFYSFLCLYLATKKNNFIYYILSFLSFINVLFLNDSRTAYIIILCLTLISFYNIITNNKIRICFLLFFISFMFTQYASNFEKRVGNIASDVKLIENNNYKSSLGLRLTWAKIGLNNLIESPFFGYGVGSYQVTTEKYLHNSQIMDKQYFVTSNPHNEFISISSQLGLPGLILFLLFILYLIKESSGVLSIGVLVLVIISSTFNSAFYDNMLGLFLVIIISLLYQKKFKIEK